MSDFFYLVTHNWVHIPVGLPLHAITQGLVAAGTSTGMTADLSLPATVPADSKLHVRVNFIFPEDLF